MHGTTHSADWSACRSLTVHHTSEEAYSRGELFVYISKKKKKKKSEKKTSLSLCYSFLTTFSLLWSKKRPVRVQLDKGNSGVADYLRVLLCSGASVIPVLLPPHRFRTLTQPANCCSLASTIISNSLATSVQYCRLHAFRP
jgi:hypothetical protein